MSLTASERARYARQVLLPEVGLVGQAKLCAATVAVNDGADSEASSITHDYLTRAGITVNNDTSALGAAQTSIASTTQVEAFAPVELRHAAAAFAGAYAATETIKAIVGAGTPATLAQHFRISSEES